MVVAVVVRLLASGQQFLPAFTRLLADPVLQGGSRSVLTGRSSAAGRFHERDVTVELHLKRSRFGYGFLVVAMRAGGEPALDHVAIADRVGDDAGRRALQTLVAHDLLTSIEAGRLKIVWSPRGFVIFPGRFVEERWRNVLEEMDALASSLEAG